MAGTRKVQLKSANLQLVKQSNLSLLFRLIYEKEPVSRADLAHITGLSPTTVSSLVDELIADSMVEEAGAAKIKTSGRKPILLKINPSGGYMVGVELTDFGFRLAAFDLRMKRVFSQDCNVDDYARIGHDIVACIREMLDGMNVGDERLQGVCVGVPGLIDKNTHRVIASTVIPIEESNDFYDVIRNAFPKATLRMGNESGFCAYLEKTCMEREVHSLIYIEINEGIGAGIIIEDRIFTGAFGNAGEFGHISVDLNGALCKCGNRGCLEAEVNLSAIRRSFCNVLGADARLSDVREALQMRDAGALQVLDGICLVLAAGINNAVNMLNPDAIVIGGGAVELGDEFLKCLQDHVSGISAKLGAKPIISFSALNEDAVTRGCARYLLDHALSKNVF